MYFITHNAGKNDFDKGVKIVNHNRRFKMVRTCVLVLSKTIKKNIAKHPYSISIIRARNLQNLQIIPKYFQYIMRWVIFDTFYCD